MVKKYPYDTSAEALLRPAQNAIFFDGWVSADTHRHSMLCAELSRLAYAPRSVIKESLPKVEFELVEFIGEDHLTARRNRHGTQAFVARRMNSRQPLTVLAFRGTESAAPEDAIADALVLPKLSDLFPGARIHRGFLDRFQVIRERISTLFAEADTPVLLTGHSLGGALATLAIAALPKIPATLITFGSPLVGDASFARLVPNLPSRSIQRYVNCCDVAARVPPERFDRKHISRLLDELGAAQKPQGSLGTLADGARALTSSALEKSFASVKPPIEFTHICQPTYIRANGQIAEGLPPADLLADQQRARADYPSHATLNRGTPLSALLKNLSRVVIGQQIPIRDLADHAPINYLSAFTGREK